MGAIAAVVLMGLLSRRSVLGVMRPNGGNSNSVGDTLRRIENNQREIKAEVSSLTKRVGELSTEQAVMCAKLDAGATRFEAHERRIERLEDTVSSLRVQERA